jgi:hypothetical protein
MNIRAMKFVFPIIMMMMMIMIIIIIVCVDCQYTLCLLALTPTLK